MIARVHPSENVPQVELKTPSTPPSPSQFRIHRSASRRGQPTRLLKPGGAHGSRGNIEHEPALKRIGSGKQRFFFSVLPLHAQNETSRNNAQAQHLHACRCVARPLAQSSWLVRHPSVDSAASIHDKTQALAQGQAPTAAHRLLDRSQENINPPQKASAKRCGSVLARTSCRAS